jgi:hypothetical protein
MTRSVEERQAGEFDEAGVQTWHAEMAEDGQPAVSARTTASPARG